MPAVDEILEPYVTSYLSLPIVTDWSDGFPVREITVDEADAFTLAEALRDHFGDTKIWPLIIEGRPDDETALSIREALEPGDGVQIGQAAIDESVGLDPLNVNVTVIAKEFR